MNKITKTIKTNWLKILLGVQVALTSIAFFVLIKLIVPFLDTFGMILQRATTDTMSIEVQLIMLFGFVYLFTQFAKLVYVVWSHSVQRLFGMEDKP